jgi:hypothetical protein
MRRIAELIQRRSQGMVMTAIGQEPKYQSIGKSTRRYAGRDIKLNLVEFLWIAV